MGDGHIDRDLALCRAGWAGPFGAADTQVNAEDKENDETHSEAFSTSILAVDVDSARYQEYVYP